MVSTGYELQVLFQKQLYTFWGVKGGLCALDLLPLLNICLLIRDQPARRSILFILALNFDFIK